eukprot:4594395-Amphidinium_carterae.1
MHKTLHETYKLDVVNVCIQKFGMSLRKLFGWTLSVRWPAGKIPGGSSISEENSSIFQPSQMGGATENFGFEHYLGLKSIQKTGHVQGA